MNARITSCFESAANTFAAIGRFLYKWRVRIATVATGHGLYLTYSWIFDNPVWWYAILLFGVLEGNAIMFVAAIINNFIFLAIYNRYRFNWLGFKEVDELRERIIKNGSNSLLIRLLKERGDLVAFFVLSLVYDSFVATTYLRHGDFGPLRKRDYWIFLSSTIFSCLYWSIRSSFIVLVAKYIWILFAA